MKVKLEKLTIKESASSNLPLFYNFIYFNKFLPLPDENPVKIAFDERLNCLIELKKPKKEISKIIDFSKK